jgi:protein FAM32A
MSSNSKAPAVVVKSKLSFKGSGGTTGSAGATKKRKAEVPEAKGLVAQVARPKDDGLTEAQRKFKKAREEADVRLAKKAVAVSYRERVEDFNTKLSKMTEHNDIPRISAAGNG